MPERKLVFVHAADLHLDSPLRGLPEDSAHAAAIRSASRRALARLIDETIARKALFLIVAGDIWDGDWQDLRTGNFFIGQMRRLRDSGIDAFIVLGNHDLHGAWQRQLRDTVPDNVTIFSSAQSETITREYCGLKVAVHGQSYDRDNQSRNLALDYPRCEAAADLNIGILHTSLAGHSGGHEKYAPCSLDDLRGKGYDYWALGHVHQRKTATAPGEAPIAYAGVLQGRQIRESGPKGAYLVSCSFAAGRADVCLSQLDVADVVWSEVDVDVAGLESREEVFGAVEDRLRGLDDGSGHVACHALRIVLRNAGPVAAGLGFNLDELRDLLSAKATAVSGKLFVGKVAVEAASGPVEVAGGLLGCLHEVAGDERFRATLADDIDAILQQIPAEVRALVVDELEMGKQARGIDGLASEAGRSLAAALSGGKG